MNDRHRMGALTVLALGLLAGCAPNGEPLDKGVDPGTFWEDFTPPDLDEECSAITGWRPAEGGPITRVDAWVFDAATGGFLSLEAHEGPTLDSPTHTVWRYVYDELGRVSEFYFGQQQVHTIVHYEYDDQDRVARVRQEFTGAYGSTRPDAVTTYTYDDDGRQLTADDEDLDRTFHYTWTADGLPDTVSHDFGRDGTFDARHTWVWTPGTRDAVVEYDEGLDGRVDAVSYETYDEAGRQVRSAWGSTMDGVIEYEDLRQYDEAGRELFWELQRWDVDGVRQFRNQRTTTYDAIGLASERTVTEWDIGEEPVLDEVGRDFADCPAHTQPEGSAIRVLPPLPIDPGTPGTGSWASR